MRVEAWLRAAARRLASSSTPHLDARILARHALGLDDAGLIVAADRTLDADEIAALEFLLARRARGESVAHIIGRKEFYGREFAVAPGILAPRPETETLIDAVRLRRSVEDPMRILDLGVGSGIILGTLLTLFRRAHGVGVDIDAAAIACAGENLKRLGVAGRAGLIRGDWFTAVHGRFDVIASNPPYIPVGARAALPPEVREFERPLALFAGADGLDAHRRILAGAPGRLAPEGLMALECGAGQAEALLALARAAFPKASITIEPDLAGIPRILIIDCARPGAAQKTL